MGGGKPFGDDRVYAVPMVWNVPGVQGRGNQDMSNHRWVMRPVIIGAWENSLVLGNCKWTTRHACPGPKIPKLTVTGSVGQVLLAMIKWGEIHGFIDHVGIVRGVP